MAGKASVSVFRAQLPHTPQLTELWQQVVLLHPTAQEHLPLSSFWACLVLWAGCDLFLWPIYSIHGGSVPLIEEFLLCSTQLPFHLLKCHASTRLHVGVLETFRQFSSSLEGPPASIKSRWDEMSWLAWLPNARKLTPAAEEVPQGKFQLCYEVAKCGDVPTPTAEPELGLCHFQALFPGFWVFAIVAVGTFFSELGGSHGLFFQSPG